MELIASDVSDEIDALQAIFGDEIIVTSCTKKDSIISIERICKPRTAGHDNSSFVSAVVRLDLPKNYPKAAPDFSLCSTSGLHDNGAFIKSRIKDYISSIELGEAMMFQLFEMIDDELDKVNNGDCMICGESLYDGEGDIGKAAFRTRCSHDFHVSCLCRWGAVSIIRSRKSKERLASQEREDAQLRSLQGQLRTDQEEVARLDAQIALLTANQKCLAAKLNLKGKEDPTALRQKMIDDITKGRSSLSNLVIDAQQTLEPEKKSVLLARMEEARSVVTRLEQQLASLGCIDDKFSPEAQQRAVTVQLASVEQALADAAKKRGRAVHREAKDQEAIQLAEERIQERRVGDRAGRAFPCPVCRQQVLEFDEKHSSWRRDYSTALEAVLKEEEAGEGRSSSG